MVKSGLPHTRPTPHDTSDLREVKDQELLQDERSALERTTWRKLDVWVLPLCTGFFLLSALDRTNIGNARVAGLQESLRLSNYQFAVALTLTLYAVSQLPSVLLLKCIGPDITLPTLAVLWGVVAALQGFVQNYSGLLACRFFLGLVKGGVPPGLVLYLSFFYPRQRLQFRIVAFYAMTALANAFSGLLATAIDQLNGKGGKPGWAWIFILEGTFTSVFGMITFFLLPRSPETARFLTENERAYVVSTLKRTGSVSEDDNKDNFSWTEVGRAAKSPHAWLLAAISFINGAQVLGQVYFVPTIVASLGYAGNRAQLMSVPPFVVTFVLSIITAIASDRYHCRGYTILFFTVLGFIGFTMFYAGASNHIRYGSLYLSVTSSFSTLPILMAWSANNSTPHTRRATAVAMSSIMLELGGIFATWLLGSWSSGPDFGAATITFIVMSLCMMAIVATNLAHLGRKNRLKAEKRKRGTKQEEPEGLGDRSAWFIYSL